MDTSHEPKRDASVSTAGTTDESEGATGSGWADKAGAVAESSREAVGATIEGVRERLPELVDAGGRTLEQVSQQAPAAIDASMDLIDRSPTTVLALAAGACGGLAVGLFFNRMPRVLALMVAGMALVLGGTLLGRRRDVLGDWE